MMEQIRQLMAARPFKPFSVVMSSGQRYRVASREHAYVNPRGTKMYVAFDDDSSVTIAALHITAIAEDEVVSSVP